uniref:Serine/threonine-protein kinase 1 n=1 Tax=viral metagenome TaxID=1070528 RepID=A0A6C0J9S9_9ZZZZ
MYKKLKLLHEGGFGKTYIVKNLHDKKTYVAKFVTTEEIINFCNHSKDNSKEEPTEVCLMNIIKKAQKTNLVQIKEVFEEVFEDKEQFIIIMEHNKDFEDFHSYLDENKLDEKQSSIIFKNIYNCIKTCNELKIFHGDIKTDNMLINRKTLEIILIDFGSGVHSRDRYTELLNDELSTLPEWLEYDSYGHDEFYVWSLGLILYEMVYDEYPFKEEEEVCEIKKPVFYQTISSQCFDLITKCIKKDPNERIKFNEILDHEWFYFQK